MPTSSSVSPSVSSGVLASQARSASLLTTPDLLRRCFTDRGEDDWFELFARVNRGILEIIRRHQRRWPNNTVDAEIEDLQQELLFRLLNRSEPFVGTSERQVWAYLEICVRRLFMDLRRFRERAKRRALRQEADLDGSLLRFELDRGSPTPEEICLSNERRRIFVDHCRVVGRRARLPFVLEEAFLGGLTRTELTRRWAVPATSINCLVIGLRRRLSAAGLDLPPRSRSLDPPTRPRCRQRPAAGRRETFFATGTNQ